MKKYQVIGGQYESCWYGESNTIRGAKIIAGRNRKNKEEHTMEIGIFLLFLEICFERVGINYERKLYSDDGRDNELTLNAEYILT